MRRPSTAQPRRAAAAVLLLACLAAAARAQNKNPCHPKKNSYGSGVKCEGVVLPPAICSKCSLKPVKPNGHFFNCKSIYNVDNPACKAELNKYVALNKCDWKRAQQLKRYNNDDKIGLDYFLYSLCEECCDCIKKGTEVKQYPQLKAKHTLWNPALFTPVRGNCPSHAYYDVCKVLPNIRYITSPGGPKGPGWPKICPMLIKWFNSPAANGWLQNQNVKINPDIKRFLNVLNSANSCTMQPVWEKCLIMEQKQNRV